MNENKVIDIDKEIPNEEAARQILFRALLNSLYNYNEIVEEGYVEDVNGIGVWVCPFTIKLLDGTPVQIQVKVETNPERFLQMGTEADITSTGEMCVVK